MKVLIVLGLWFLLSMIVAGWASLLQRDKENMIAAKRAYLKRLYDLYEDKEREDERNGKP